MSGRPISGSPARAWAVKAEHDLVLAVHGMTIKTDCPYDMICFHAQQCVEKYLKALLASRGIKNPRSHDLTEIVGLLPASFRPRMSMNRLAKLNPYAVESRYPSPGKPETRQEALQALKTASTVRQEALRMLGVRKPSDLK